MAQIFRVPEVLIKTRDPQAAHRSLQHIHDPLSKTVALLALMMLNDSASDATMQRVAITALKDVVGAEHSKAVSNEICQRLFTTLTDSHIPSAFQKFAASTLARYNLQLALKLYGPNKDKAVSRGILEGIEDLRTLALLAQSRETDEIMVHYVRVRFQKVLDKTDDLEHLRRLLTSDITDDWIRGGIQQRITEVEKSHEV